MTSGCADPESGPGSDPDTTDDGGGLVAVSGTRPLGGGPEPDPLVPVSFVESAEDFANPERGFYVGVDLLSPATANAVRASGHTLAIALVRLDAYRERPLDQGLLAALADGFAAVRAAGVKVVLRFVYNAGFEPDATKARILEHIAQLAPLLEANGDVIAVVQAGFIGAWGEWHSSTNGLDNDADRTDILAALLTAVPVRRAVQVRTPMFKDAAFPGGPVTDEAWGTPRARVGHHNDCFLASEDDLGTYAQPVSAWRSYVAQDTRRTAMGGETCGLYPPRTDCAAALAEMADYHWSYLNRDYNPAVIQAWADQGCEAEVRKRLGYRLALVDAAHTPEVAPGGTVDLVARIANRGFAAPINERPVSAVIAGQGMRLIARLPEVDARSWAPGEIATIAARLQLPAALPPGRYSIALRLPDPDPALAADPRYAIRLANDGVWDESTGDNVVTRDLVVAP